VSWVVSSRVPVAAILFVLALPLTAVDPVTEARRALTEGQRLAWINNWTQARPHFERAEKLYAEAGGARNALFAKIGRLRGEWETLSFPEVSQYLRLFPAAATIRRGGLNTVAHNAGAYTGCTRLA
jgi:hypothetical protein